MILSGRAGTLGRCHGRALLALLTCLVVLGALPGRARAGAWTQPKSQLWLKGALIYRFTRTIYAAEEGMLPDGTPVRPGDLRPYNDGGAARLRSLWFEAEYGLSNRLTLGARFPFQTLRFEDAFQLTESWGIGDIQFITRVALLDGRQRLTLRAAWKLAVGQAATDPDDVPVSEGQDDLELGLQWGTTLGHPLSWIGAEGGYRWRLEDGEGRIPGDEWYWRLEAGFVLQESWNLALKLGYNALRAQTTLRGELPEPGSRRYDQLELGLLWRRGDWILEPLWVSTLAGERYPAGYAWILGLHHFFGL